MKLFIGMCLIIMGVGLIYLYIFSPTFVHNEKELYCAIEKGRRKIILTRGFNITKDIEIPKNITLVFLSGQIHMSDDRQLTLYSPQTIQTKTRKRT